MSDYPLWRDATWRQRVGISIAWVLATLMGVTMFGAGLYVLVTSLDGIGAYREQHDQCLKRATTGYEIRECGR